MLAADKVPSAAAVMGSAAVPARLACSSLAAALSVVRASDTAHFLIAARQNMSFMEVWGLVRRDWAKEGLVNAQ